MAKLYLAVSLGSGITIVNNTDELGCLFDNDIPYDVLGAVCDTRSFGDNCVSCPLRESCPSTNVIDMDGHKWHVISDEKFNAMPDSLYSMFWRFLDERFVCDSLFDEDSKVSKSFTSIADKSSDELPF